MPAGLSLRATPASTVAISLDGRPISDGPLLLVEIDRRPITAVADPVIETSGTGLTVTGTLAGTSLHVAWSATRIAGDAWEFGLELRNDGADAVRITRIIRCR